MSLNVHTKLSCYRIYFTRPKRNKMYNNIKTDEHEKSEKRSATAVQICLEVGTHKTGGKNWLNCQQLSFALPAFVVI